MGEVSTIPEEAVITKVYKATQNYSPRRDKEMSLIKGDILTEVQIVDERWAAGRNFRGFVGVFPLNCVKEVTAVHNYRLPVDALLNEIGQMNYRKAAKPPLQNQPDCIHQATLNSNDEDGSDDKSEENKEELTSSTIQKTKKSFFSKPKMLVKPRTSKLKRFSFTSKQASPSRNNKDKNLSATFPMKEYSKDSGSYVSNQVIEKSPYYSQPSSQCNTQCTCGFSSSQTVRKNSSALEMKRASSVEIYENTRVHQNPAFLCSNNNSVHNSNNNSANSSALLYAKINTPSKRQFQILNRSVTPQHSYAVNNQTESSCNPMYHTTPCHNSYLSTPYYTSPYHTISQLTLVRFVGSCFTVLLIGSLSLLLMIFLAKIPFLYCIIASFSIVLILFFLFLFSRLFRCIFALSIPSLSTNAGHIFEVILISLLLCWGPVSDIENNITSSVGSYACLLEQVNNQTSLLMRPYDAVMQQLNTTLSSMEDAARSVDKALYPLQQSLNLVDHKLQRGRSELTTTKQTCLNQFSKAKEACTAGLVRARDQCQEVMSEIGSVYREAKEAIDRINPNKWGVKSKRQISRDSAFLRRNKDICEPLNEKTACKSFQDGKSACDNSYWAGHAIQEALNTTKVSLNNLYSHFRFHTSSKPYKIARRRSQEAAATFRRDVLTAQHQRHSSFQYAILITQRLSILLVIIPFLSAYVYVFYYVSDETYDNQYGEEQLKSIDHFKNSVYKAPRLLPLRKHEKLYIDHGSFSAKRIYKGRCIGFTLLISSSILFFWLNFINFRMQQMLRTVVARQTDIEDLSGWKSLDLMVTGEGMFVDIINTFLSNLHTGGRFFGLATNHTACLPPKTHFSFLFFVINVSVMIVFLLTVLLKPQMLHLRGTITGYFYEESLRGRLVWLHDHLSHRRCLFPKVLYAMVREVAKRRHLRKNISCMHECAIRNFNACPQRCLLCLSTGSNFTTQKCEMSDCFGLYCSSCFSDLNQLCPICHIATTSSMV